MSVEAAILRLAHATHRVVVRTDDTERAARHGVSGPVTVEQTIARLEAVAERLERSLDRIETG